MDKKQYDVGIVYRSNHNYGANMTHLSLCLFLEKLGKSVLMIDLPEDSELYLPIDNADPFSLFKGDCYAGVSFYRAKHCWDLLEICNICKCYIVGSDQLWRNYFLKRTNYYSTLDWVDDESYKISYSTSLGVDYFEGSSWEIEEFSNRIKRLNSISVREKSGKDIIKNICGRTAECVIDPVFLCDTQQLSELLKFNEMVFTAEKYVGAYILDESEQKLSFILRVMEHIQVQECNLILDAMTKHEQRLTDHRINVINAKIEDWLAMIKNCEILITDSFHGTCFAIIFRKPFYVLSSESNHRGFARIENLLNRIGLEDRIIRDEQVLLYNISQCLDINYYEAISKLNMFIIDSKKWLQNEVSKAEIYKKEEQKWNKYQIDLNKRKKEYESKLRWIVCCNKNILDFSKPVVLWGTGECLKKNIKWLTDILHIEYVADSNPKKWGKDYIDGIRCESWNKIKEHYRGQDIQVLIMILNNKIVEEIEQYLLKDGVKKVISYRKFEENTKKYIKRNKIIYIPFPYVSNDTTNEISENLVNILKEKYEVVDRMDPELHEKSLLETRAIFLSWVENNLTEEHKRQILAYKKAGTKIVWFFHNKQPHDASKDALENLDWLANQCDIIIILSKSSITYIPGDTENKDKAVYLPHIMYSYNNANNMAEISRERYGINENDFVFLIFGLLRPYKNIELAINVFKSIKRKGVKLLIAGRPCDEEYEKEIVDLIGDDVDIITDFRFLSDHELDGVIDISDIVLMTYLDKSSMNSGVLIKAFSSKKAVIAPTICMVNDIDEDFFYRWSTENELISAMQNAMECGKESLRDKGICAYLYMRKNNNRDIVRDTIFLLIDSADDIPEEGLIKISRTVEDERRIYYKAFICYKYLFDIGKNLKELNKRGIYITDWLIKNRCRKIALCGSNNVRDFIRNAIDVDAVEIMEISTDVTGEIAEILNCQRVYDLHSVDIVLSSRIERTEYLLEYVRKSTDSPIIMIEDIFEELILLSK